MKEIQEIVNSKVSEMIASGEIEDQIKGGIKLSIESAINKQFESYGSVTRQLEDVLKESLKIDKRNLDIPRFTAVMEGVINQHINEFFKGEAAKRFSDMMKNKLAPMPQEMPICDFVNMICKEWKGDDRDLVDEFATVEFEKYDCNLVGGYTLKIWKQKKVSSYSSSDREADIHIHIDTEFTIAGNHAKDPYYVFDHDAIIFKAYAQNVKFTGLDEFEPEDDCNLSLVDSDYY